MFTTVFWRATAERAVSTGAQFALLTLGVGLVAGTGDSLQADVINAFAVNWLTLGGAFLGGCFVTVLKCLAFGAKTGEPSATTAETLNTPTVEARGRHAA